MIIFKKITSILLAMTVLLGFTLFDFSKALAASNTTNENNSLDFVNEDEELETYLMENSFINAIENIPDNILEDPEAIVEWFQQNAGQNYKFETDGENLIIDGKTENSLFMMKTSGTQNSKIQTFGVATCVGAIGTALVTGILPIAKITKIKNALKAVGGTSRFVKNLMAHYKFNRNRGWSRSKSYDDAFDRATKAYGPEIKRELGALFGITAVYGACFE